VGALACLFLNDRFGRLRTWQGSAVWWMSGLLMQIFSSGIYGFELFARFWGGFGAGSLTVVVPIYLAECAPTRSRGKVTTWYMVSLLGFLMLGKFKQVQPGPTSDLPGWMLG
jgi:MFS family permease